MVFGAFCILVGCSINGSIGCSVKDSDDMTNNADLTSSEVLYELSKEDSNILQEEDAAFSKDVVAP